jgi:hypothetical protein
VRLTGSYADVHGDHVRLSVQIPAGLRYGDAFVLTSGRFVCSTEIPWPPQPVDVTALKAKLGIDATFYIGPPAPPPPPPGPPPLPTIK